MNLISRTVSGAVTVALGVVIVYATVTEGAESWSLVWGVLGGVFVCGVGIYLFFNKGEDKIDEIKHKEK